MSGTNVPVVSGAITGKTSRVTSGSVTTGEQDKVLTNDGGADEARPLYRLNPDEIEQLSQQRLF